MYLPLKRAGVGGSILFSLLYSTSLIFSNSCSHLRASGEIPALSFSRDTFDLGTLRAGQKTLADIEFRNTSDTAVQIIGFSSSCKCIVVENKPFSMPPNSRDVITVNIEADSTEKGQVFRSVALRTSEIKKPVKIAILSFRVI